MERPLGSEKVSGASANYPARTRKPRPDFLSSAVGSGQSSTGHRILKRGSRIYTLLARIQRPDAVNRGSRPPPPQPGTFEYDSRPARGHRPQAVHRAGQASLRQSRTERWMAGNRKTAPGTTLFRDGVYRVRSNLAPSTLAPPRSRHTPAARRSRTGRPVERSSEREPPRLLHAAAAGVRPCRPFFAVGPQPTAPVRRPGRIHAPARRQSDASSRRSGGAPITRSRRRSTRGAAPRTRRYGSHSTAARPPRARGSSRWRSRVTAASLRAHRV